jgi:hypothetical protein
MQWYWEFFNSPCLCPRAFEFYRRGVHIGRMYGVPFSKIGCRDETAFHKGAMKALVRTLEHWIRRYEEACERQDHADMTRSHDHAIHLRADLARLMLIHASEDERAGYAGKFMTVG